MQRAGLIVVSLCLTVAAFGLYATHAQGVAAGTKQTSNAVPSDAQTVPDHPGFYVGEAGLNASERAGREIWYKATAGNDRFHTYTFQQRIGVLIDWYRVLNAPERADRFRAWGIINDPGCCTPGDANCPAKSLEETYGFEYCPGDAQLLPFVGRAGYRDPACDFKDAPADTTDIHHRNKDQRQTSCDLAFGTSTGALGFRKFPNPRFDKKRWLQLNGTLATWEGYRKKLTTNANNADSSASHLSDGSIEPPFLIGMSCGACHIAYDPLKPPRDPANPQWENIKGGVGNQYTRISEVLSSGMPQSSIEFQVFAHARPGATDTSAVPTDQVSNPGTINAIINTKARPTFRDETVSKWRATDTCAAKEDQAVCWCEPGREGKCWRKSTATDVVHHILKGGEDSVGAKEAIQRVYFNIGSCSEQCWVNHLTDLRQLDPKQRNFGQTPFDIGQCRRDCPNFRAVEDRLGNILDFFLSHDNDDTDLAVARANARAAKTSSKTSYGQEQLIADLNKEFAPGTVAQGREVFVANCARCHSSIPDSAANPIKNRDFRAVDPTTGLRADWLGNDQATPATGVETNRCRALHSNHMKGHVWQEYGSETLRARAGDPNVADPGDGGRGYYRNVSLLSVWAHAPFLHNNAVGPEICGKPANSENDFYRSPYVDGKGQSLSANQAPACWAYDPSVDGRFKLYKASMAELLNPEQRVPKRTKFSNDVPISFGPRLWDGEKENQVIGFTATIPAGSTAAALGTFQHKQLAGDLVELALRPEDLHSDLTRRLGATEGEQLMTDLREISAAALKNPASLVDVVRQKPNLLDAYSSCTERVENAGHRFGADLSDSDKKSLTAFLATL